MSTERADLPRFEIRPLSSHEGGGYLVEFQDYPGCMADGETPEEAMQPYAGKPHVRFRAGALSSERPRPYPY